MEQEHNVSIVSKKVCLPKENRWFCSTDTSSIVCSTKL